MLLTQSMFSMARLLRLASLAAVMGLASVSAGHAQSKPFGKGFDGWSFTATKEKAGIVNCRAIRKVGDREDIIAVRSDYTAYLSVNAEGRKGKWPDTIIAVPGKPRGVLEWTTTGEANGVRMWFPLDHAVIMDIMMAGGAFEFALPDSEDTAIIRLGKRALDAWARVNDCVAAHGG